MQDQDLKELQAAEEKYLNINQMGLCILNRNDKMYFRAAFFFNLTFWAIGSIDSFHRVVSGNQEKQDLILLHADTPFSWKIVRGC